MKVNRKRVRRLMRLMGLEALYPRPRTSRAGKGHTVYPYLLRELTVERPNQVWATDICYLPMARGFLYLVAVMDWYSRKVLAWRLSNTLDSDFCVEAVEDALAHYGRPEIFNTDQGAQFTSAAFTSVLKGAGVAISMDGKGRWVDNVFVERLWRSVKYEEVYLHAYESVAAARAGLWAATSGSTMPSAAIRASGAGHPTRCMLTAAHGPRQREAGEPTGAEDTYRPVQLSGSTSTESGAGAMWCATTPRRRLASAPTAPRCSKSSKVSWPACASPRPGPTASGCAPCVPVAATGVMCA